MNWWSDVRQKKIKEEIKVKGIEIKSVRHGGGWSGMLAKIMERNFNCVLSFTEKYADSAESEFFIVN